MFITPGFRFVVIGVMFLLAFAGETYGQGRQHREGLAVQGIETSELEFRNVDIRRAAGGGYVFVGQIRNHSDRYTLASVAIGLTFYDCKTESGVRDCVVIGERRESIYLAIPPKQARNFKEPIYSYGDVLNSQGALVWEVNVLSTQAVPSR